MNAIRVLVWLVGYALGTAYRFRWPLLIASLIYIAVKAFG